MRCELTRVALLAVSAVDVAVPRTEYGRLLEPLCAERFRALVLTDNAQQRLTVSSPSGLLPLSAETRFEQEEVTACMHAT